MGVGGFLVAGERVGVIRRYFGGFGEWGGGLGGGEDYFIAVWPLIVLRVWDAIRVGKEARDMRGRRDGYVRGGGRMGMERVLEVFGGCNANVV